MTNEIADQVIWCGERGGYWLPNGEGYTANIDQAWRVTQEFAEEVCRSMGPEKEMAIRPAPIFPIDPNGFRTDRLQRNPKERAFRDQWAEENRRGRPGFATTIVLKELIPDLTIRDQKVAATVIQWLGSNVGQGFIEMANARGKRYKLQSDEVSNTRL